MLRHQKKARVFTVIPADPQPPTKEGNLMGRMERAWEWWWCILAPFPATSLTPSPPSKLITGPSSPIVADEAYVRLGYLNPRSLLKLPNLPHTWYWEHDQLADMMWLSKYPSCCWTAQKEAQTKSSFNVKILFSINKALVVGNCWLPVSPCAVPSRLVISSDGTWDEITLWLFLCMSIVPSSHSSTALPHPQCQQMLHFGAKQEQGSEGR